MSSKFLAVGILSIGIILSASSSAFGQGGGAASGEVQVKQQGQVVNQGESIQIQAEIKEQDRVGDGSGTTVEVQSQVQTQNKGEEAQVQNREQEEVQVQKQEKTSSTIAEQRRSEVSIAVQEMLQVADRNGGIGQQVKVIAQAQNQNQEKLEVSLEKVESRGGFAKFFIGANYKEINNANKLLEENREQIQKLNEIKNQLMNQADQQSLALQIQTLERANLEIENSLAVSQKGFSLFGWLFRWAAK